jgi:hypothetical protein
MCQEIHRIYGTQRPITAFTEVLHWNISSARLTQRIPSHTLSIITILITYSIGTRFPLNLNFTDELSGCVCNSSHVFHLSSIPSTSIWSLQAHVQSHEPPRYTDNFLRQFSLKSKYIITGLWAGRPRKHGSILGRGKRLSRGSRLGPGPN